MHTAQQNAELSERQAVGEQQRETEGGEIADHEGSSPTIEL